MTETNQHPNSATNDKSKWQPLWDWWAYSGVKWLLGFATIILIGIGVLAYTAPDVSQKMNILAVGILGVITFVVTVINALSTSRMADIMERQETEMTNTRIIVKDQHKAMVDALEETKAIVKQNERAIKASQRQARAAEKALIASDDMFYISQRAYFAIDRFYLADGKFIIGKVPVIEMVFRNAGKTSADRVTAGGQFTTSDKTTIVEIEKESKAIPQRHFVADSIAAGQSVEAFTPSEDVPVMTADRLYRLKKGKAKYFAFIHFYYDDIRGEQDTVFRFEYQFTKDGEDGGFIRYAGYE